VKARLLGSLTIGVIVAIALVAFEGKYRHAALVASAAKSSDHQTVTSILADGFAGTTLAVALVVFVLATVLGAPRRARQAAARRQRQDTPVRRRSRAGTGW
jgi:hypothetical protein